MTSRDQREHIHVELPYETKRAAKESDRPMWEIIDEGVRVVLGLEDEGTETAIQRRLEKLETKYEKQLTAAEEREKEAEKIQGEIQNLREKLQEIQEEKATYESQLEQILAQMEREPSKNIRAWKDDVRDAAREGYGHATQQTRTEVIEDLRERNRDGEWGINSERFRATSVVGKVDQSAADGAPTFKTTGE